MTPDIDTRKPGRPPKSNATRAAETADAEQRVLNTEYTLIMKNEAAHGVVADIFGFTSAS